MELCHSIVVCDKNCEIYVAFLFILEYAAHLWILGVFFAVSRVAKVFNDSKLVLRVGSSCRAVGVYVGYAFLKFESRNSSFFRNLI